VAFTLRRLLEHPRLKLLRQAENVWAFKIVEPAAAGTGSPKVPADWTLFFPTTAWNSA